ncbi:unnamed protein product [Clonostachys rosea]|uniref:Uncharacterized protein n=1 Tax=Bionectria ochroleuca TaxID=29856 RepID=A0ABY6TQF8_BIOOC|nr:unnamed protein product [Clonostachys rosea]
MGVQDSLSLGARRAAALSLDANTNLPNPPNAKGTIQAGKASKATHAAPRSLALDAPPAHKRAKRFG